MLAELLLERRDFPAASIEFERLLDQGALPDDSLVAAGRAALLAEQLQLAARCLDAAGEAGVTSGTTELQRELREQLATEGEVIKVPAGETAVGADDFVEAGDRTTFADIGGLEDVKEAVRRTIIKPFERPDLYLAYGRRAGGGVLLYGPPGCGKTLVARATAGECGLPFFNLRIEDILDPYLGASEGNLHEAFEHVRSQAPCVLFIDELDAIAFPRRKQQGHAARSLVDQLLQELDAIGADNVNLLILAATNAPWDVDDALKRPGRFDRLLFVPPPDEPARAAILELRLAGRPQRDIDHRALARQAALFSGADLGAVVEQAVDAVIDKAIETGEQIPIEQRHLEGALNGMAPTTLEWLSAARNFVEFANEGGRYDDVANYLQTRDAKRARRRRPGRERDTV
jgi:SpoVK/Ycf46/Vps4 family AAA+-type ATPase